MLIMSLIILTCHVKDPVKSYILLMSHYMVKMSAFIPPFDSTFTDEPVEA